MATRIITGAASAPLVPIRLQKANRGHGQRTVSMVSLQTSRTHNDRVGQCKVLYVVREWGQGRSKGTKGSVLKSNAGV